MWILPLRGSVLVTAHVLSGSVSSPVGGFREVILLCQSRLIKKVVVKYKLVYRVVATVREKKILPIPQQPTAVGLTGYYKNSDPYFV
jgi:hypothetical protein